MLQGQAHQVSPLRIHLPYPPRPGQIHPFWGKPGVYGSFEKGSLPHIITQDIPKIQYYNLYNNHQIHTGHILRRQIKKSETPATSGR